MCQKLWCTHSRNLPKCRFMGKTKFKLSSHLYTIFGQKGMIKYIIFLEVSIIILNFFYFFFNSRPTTLANPLLAPKKLTKIFATSPKNNCVLVKMLFLCNTVPTKVPINRVLTLATPDTCNFVFSSQIFFYSICTIKFFLLLI